MKKTLIAILLMAPLSLCAQKFAHFNTAEIIPNMKEYTTAMEEMQAMHLDVPPMTALADGLRREGMPLPLGILTVEDMVREVEKYVH
jgi:hypothetical protein